MDLTPTTSIPALQPRPLAQAEAVPAALKVEAQRLPATAEDAFRQRVGEFVGGVFYATLLRQMQDSTIKGQYMHGGRGEEVFQGQLALDLARRMGRAPNDPIAGRLYQSMRRYLGKGIAT